jgi:hypothetical protein
MGVLSQTSAIIGINIQSRLLGQFLPARLFGSFFQHLPPAPTLDIIAVASLGRSNPVHFILHPDQQPS